MARRVEKGRERGGEGGWWSQNMTGDAKCPHKRHNENNRSSHDPKHASEQLDYRVNTDPGLSVELTSLVHGDVTETVKYFVENAGFSMLGMKCFRLS